MVLEAGTAACLAAGLWGVAGMVVCRMLVGSRGNKVL